MNNAVIQEVPSFAKRRFLVFHIARRVYALPAETVVEVIRIPLTARVPQAPKALIGIANLRGVVLPIASLRCLLGLEVEESAGSRAIVLDGGAPVAIVVDAVDALVTIDAERIETQAAQLSVEQGERVTGAFPLGDGQGAAKILDAQALLAEAFARRTRPSHPNSVRGITATREPETAAEREIFVTFDVAGQEFAIDLGLVEEIIALPAVIAAAPRTEAAVAGVMAFREKLLPLLFMRELLGFGPAPVSEMRAKIIVTSVGSALVGLVADRARAVIAAEPSLIDPVPAVIQARSGGEARIKSVYRGEEGRRLVSILAPDQLFRGDVMKRLGEVHDAASRTQPQISPESEERKFLVFRLGEGEFGLPVEAVDEVARAPDRVTRVPKAPRFLEGVINLRGIVIPVIDQRRRFDMPRFEEFDGRRLVVVRTGRHRAGLIVDGVSEVLRTTVGAIKDAPDLTEDIARLVLGVVNIEAAERIILVLHPDELLTRAEHGLLDKFESSAQPAS
jgi:purine-binding chemotaxis protein CheW